MKKFKLTETQEKIQNRMKEIRTQDNQNIRDLVKQKLIWIDNEMIKGNELIKNFKEKINQTAIMIIKLEGAKSALENLIFNEKK